MPSPTSSTWLHTLGRLAMWLLAALVIGVLLGHAWAALALAALAALAWQLWKLNTLLVTLEAHRRIGPATGHGAWRLLQRLLHRRQDDARTRKRRILEMLRAYRAIAAALPDAIVVVERNSQRVEWFNEAATRLLGLGYPHDIGEPLGKCLQPLPIAHWLTAGRNAEPLLDAPSPLDPTVRLHLRLIPYSDDLWLLVARDVSKLMRLEQIRRDFVANVSHELRTPLTVVHGYLDMLDPADQPNWAPMLAEMQRQSQRMTQLVEDLLTLSRLESHDHLDEETVAMAPMLATLGREAQALSQDCHIVEVRDQAGVDLLGSTHELHSAFSNLVSNAVRYTPTGGRIEIDFHRDGNDVLLTVRDSGYGIPATHLPRLSERFYRVSTSRSRDSGGTGLGLAIVKHVLNRHQARLEIASEVGSGSTFACRFGADRSVNREAAR